VSIKGKNKLYIKIFHICISVIFLLVVMICLTCTGADAAAAPSGVSGFHYNAVSSNAVRLSWTAQNGAEGYIVYQNKNGTNSFKRIGKGVYKGTFLVKGLTPNTKYKFAVRAYKTVKAKEVLSPTCPVITVETMSPKVTELEASVIDYTADVNWKASKGAAGYYVYFNYGAGWITLGNTTKTSFSKELIIAADSYSFGIRPYKIINKSRVLSSDFAKTNNKVVNIPKPVSGFSVKSIGAETIQLTWATDPNAQGYVVYQNTAGTNSFKRIGKGVYNGAFLVNGLTPNTKYRFAVRAFNTVDKKEYLSPTFPIVSTETMSPALKNLKITTSAERVNLRWSPSIGAEGYYIYYDCGDGWVEYGDTTKNYFIKKYLEGGTYYTFLIKPYKHINGKMVLSRDVATISEYTHPSIPKYTIKKDNDTYTLSWDAPKGATEYIIYSQVPGENWVRKGTTISTTFAFTQEDTPEIYLGVRAVMKVNGVKYISDYQKQYYFDNEPNGTLYSFGDSIANGMGSMLYSYAELYAEENKLEIYRDTRNGAGMGSAINAGHIAENVIRRIKPNSSYTYIMLEGGFNDYYYNCPLGDVTPAGTTDFDINTVCGALETAITHIGKNSPDSKVLFVLPHDPWGRYSIKNDLGITFEEYAERIKAVCDKYGVVVADCRYTLNTKDIELSKIYTYHNFEVHPSGDTVHPTEEAYRLFYLPVVREAAAVAEPVKLS